MPKELSWREAIEAVLRDEGKAMHYTDIAAEIVQRRLRTKVGATPAGTVNYELNRNMRDLADESLFVRTNEGEYALRSLLSGPGPGSAAAPREEAVAVLAKAPRIIAAFGMFWRRELVLWTSAPRLLGQQQRFAQEVDLAEQRGLYLLHDGRHVVYVGRVVDQGLAVRLAQHTRDRLNGRWDRFSWFGLSPVDEQGKVSPPGESMSVTPVMLIGAMEALLIEATEPPQNRKGSEELREFEFIQVEDKELEKSRKKRLLQELSTDLLG